MNMIDRFRLDGKRALVTGGGNGIGRAYSHALAEAGADVAIVDIQPEFADRVSEEIRKIGRSSMAIEADTSNHDDVKRMVKAVVDEWGRLDIAINNVGISIRGNAETFPLEDWDRVVEINMKGSFMCAQEEGKVMIGQKYGKIVFTSSISGNIINKPQYQISMSVSKAGIQHLTRCLAVEWAKYGVRVNCISPGYIYTEALDAPDLKPNIPMWTELTPVGRLGKVEDLQGAVVFLSSDVSDFMTGQNLKIDGGYTLM